MCERRHRDDKLCLKVGIGCKPRLVDTVPEQAVVENAVHIAAKRTPFYRGVVLKGMPFLKRLESVEGRLECAGGILVRELFLGPLNCCGERVSVDELVLNRLRVILRKCSVDELSDATACRIFYGRVLVAAG